MTHDGSSTDIRHALPATLPDLLALRTRQEGHRPMLTCYDEVTGARTELSYATVDNWAAKTANMLVEELDCGPGTRIALDLDGHWTTVPMVLACWKLGAQVVTGGTGADVVCCHERLADAHPTGLLVVVGDGFTAEPLGAVAERDGLLLLGGEVHSFADDYDDDGVTAQTPALDDGDAAATQADVLASARAWWGVLGDDPRVGLAVPLGDPDTVTLLAGVVAAGGALVAVRGGDHAAHWATERVTVVVTPDDTDVTAPEGARVLTFGQATGPGAA